MFLYINIDDDDNVRILEFFGMKLADCPALRFIILAEDMVKYRPTSTDLTVSGIQQFVQDVLDGTAKVIVIYLMLAAVLYTFTLECYQMFFLYFGSRMEISIPNLYVSI
jgi:Thioredoxin-like domain